MQSPRDREADHLGRTTWVEAQAARFCELPLVAETVFHSLRYVKGRLAKEVVDILVRLRSDAILVSLKAQEQPNSRDEARLEHWSRKAARGAAGQLRGAVKTLNARPFWCRHWRRGRVEFRPGVVEPRHAVVAVEMPLGTSVELPPEAELSAGNVPVSFMTLNDFLNVVDQFRTFPDLIEYLDARIALGDAVRRTLGHERLFFGHYLRNGGEFAAARTLSEVAASLGQDIGNLNGLLWAKHVADIDAAVVEHMAEALATRAPDYVADVDAVTLAHYDLNEARSAYLALQEELCDLRLGERRRLGQMARRLFETLPDKGIQVQSCHVDTKPDFLYVVIGAAAMERRKLHESMRGFLIGGLAYYRKRRGMAIATRPGKGYEFLMTELPSPTADEAALGAKLFGHLKVISEPVGLLPNM